uniref:hypothetical protein n=1 Tax=Pseudomonas TaxID=286 RepID=UPI00155DAF4D|nr:MULTISPECIES: hypothetical protein [Pseudomonas]
MREVIDVHLDADQLGSVVAFTADELGDLVRPREALRKQRPKCIAGFRAVVRASVSTPSERPRVASSNSVVSIAIRAWARCSVQEGTAKWRDSAAPS